MCVVIYRVLIGWLGFGFVFFERVIPSPFSLFLFLFFLSSLGHFLFGAHADFVGRMGKKVNPRSSLSFVHFPFVGLRWPAGFYSLHFLYYLSRHLICVLCVCVWGNTSGKSPCGIDTKSLFFFLIFFQINSLRIGHTLLCRLILI